MDKLSHKAIAFREQLRARREHLAAVGQRRPPLRVKVARQLHPTAIALSYYRDLRGIVEEFRQMVEKRLTPRLSDVVRAAGVVRKDSWGEDVDDAIDQITDDLFAQFTNEKLKQEADKVAGQTSAFQKKQLQNQFRNALGIDIYQAEPDLKPLIGAFAEENVALIRSIPTQTASQLKSVIIGGVRSGMRADELAEKIGERFDVSDSRAALIARDQISKLNGQINEARQTELGIESYEWDGVKDNRERDTHLANEGKIFRWDDPPAETGHPGDDVNCRCSATPNLQPIFDGL